MVRSMLMGHSHETSPVICGSTTEEESGRDSLVLFPRLISLFCFVFHLLLALPFPVLKFSLSLALTSLMSCLRNFL